MIDRAQAVLKGLEQVKTLGPDRAARLADELPLFTALQLQSDFQETSTTPSPLENALAEIIPDNLSPREALDLIYRWKAEVEDI